MHRRHRLLERPARHRPLHGSQARRRLHWRSHHPWLRERYVSRQGHPVQCPDERAKSRYAFIAKDVLHLAGETEDELVEALVQKIRDLNDALDIPQGIKNYGQSGVKADESIIDYDEFEAKKADVAANAILDACTAPTRVSRRRRRWSSCSSRLHRYSGHVLITR